MATQKGTAFEVKGSRPGSGTLEDGSAYIDKLYQVEFTDTTAIAIDAWNASGVPAWGAALAGYTLYALEKSADPDSADQCVWKVRVRYKTLRPETVFPNPVGSPGSSNSDHVWQVFKRVDPYPVEVPIQKDLAGKVMVNVLGEPILPTPTRVIYDRKFSIQFLTDRPDQTSIDACEGKVNNGPVTITLAGANFVCSTNTLQFQSPPLEEIIDQNGSLVARAVYDLLYRKDSWTGLFANISRDQLAPGGTLGYGGTNNTPIVIGSGTNAAFATEPQYISNSGTPLALGQGVTIVNNGSGFNYLQTANFHDLLAGLASA